MKKKKINSEAASQRSMARDLQNHLLFEVATEVANRVGGIYSVLKSKAPVTVAQYGDNYTLLGPLNKATYESEVEKLDWEDESIFPEELLPIQKTLMSMREKGVNFVYGNWLIEGAPRVILFELDSVRHFLN